MYQFKVIHMPGGSHTMQTADATSRHPATAKEDAGSMAESGEIEDNAHAYAAATTEGIESITWHRVSDVAATDEECVTLCEQIREGFPDDRNKLPPTLRYYWQMKDDLYVIKNVPFKDQRMLLPAPLRAQVLEGLHAANQGVTGMTANAKERFFWPGLGASIRLPRSQCRQCNEQAPSQADEPSMEKPPPEMPFEQTAVDLCHLAGHDFLIYADRYSGWVEVARLNGSTFRHIRIELLRWFMTYGVPGEIATDGGPPFQSAEYANFRRVWDIRRRLSSAYYPQSNGRAEVAVKSMKRTLPGNINPVTGQLDTDAAARAVMTHRNTPAQHTGIAPSVALFGRPLRDLLPRLDRQLCQEWQLIADSREDALAKHHLLTDTRKEDGTPRDGRNLPDLQSGDYVGNYPKWHHTGIVTETLPNRQYHVLMDGSRRVTLRNRKFLGKILPVCRKDYLMPPITTPLSPTTLPQHPGATNTPAQQEDLPETTNEVRLQPPPGHATPLPPVQPTEPTTQPSIMIPCRLQMDIAPEVEVRRSSCMKTRPEVFSPKLKGKSHK